MTISRVYAAQEALELAEKRVRGLTEQLKDAKKTVDARRLQLSEAITDMRDGREPLPLFPHIVESPSQH